MLEVSPLLKKEISVERVQLLSPLAGAVSRGGHVGMSATVLVVTTGESRWYPVGGGRCAAGHPAGQRGPPHSDLAPSVLDTHAS